MPILKDCFDRFSLFEGCRTLAKRVENSSNCGRRVKLAVRSCPLRWSAADTEPLSPFPDGITLRPEISYWRSIGTPAFNGNSIKGIAANKRDVGMFAADIIFHF